MVKTANKKYKTFEEKQLSVSNDYQELSTDDKINKIESHFREIMETLGLDLNDDSLKDTPHRVAKMYVTEIFEGLNPEFFPKISLFENRYGYNEMLIEKDIQVYSHCEHHFIPFIGKAHVAYIPAEKVIGLSKINRIVKYFSRRPQVQERLTMEIAEALKEVLQTEDIAVAIEARHLCVAARGVEDTHSITATNHLSGRFKETEHRQIFYAAFSHSKS
jgi:GTP cyclohydrolase IA